MSRRVLVVDDDSAVRQVIVAALTDAGFDCVSASDGADALELARHHTLDAVVLDIHMPRVSGDDVYQALRRDALTRYTPVIFLTAERESRQKVKRLLDGADDYMTKPFDTEELAARVTAAIRRSRELRALNPLSGLPGNAAISTEMSRRLENDSGWACLYCDVDHFKAFNDHYGFARGDELIVALARILVAVAAEASTEAFVGHVGGDDFVVIVPEGTAENAAREIVRRFDSAAPALYDAEDSARGFIVRADRQGIERRMPLASVSIGVVAMTRARFVDFIAVSRAAAEVKEVAKRRDGSTWAVDRRRSTEGLAQIPVA